MEQLSNFWEKFKREVKASCNDKVILSQLRDDNIEIWDKLKLYKKLEDKFLMWIWENHFNILKAYHNGQNNNASESD